MSLADVKTERETDSVRDLARTMRGTGAFLVASRDVHDAARFALGAAERGGLWRRLALADLTGEAFDLQQLVSDDDPHGLADVFEYGISVNRVARQVDDSGRVFVIPAGTDSADRPEVLGADRWRRLSAAFREAESLLLVVATSTTPELELLAAQLDGVIAADDDAVTLALPGVIPAAAAQPTSRLGDAEVPIASAPAADRPSAEGREADALATPPAALEGDPPAKSKTTFSRTFGGLMAGLGLLLLGLVGLEVSQASEGGLRARRSESIQRAGSVARDAAPPTVLESGSKTAGIARSGLAGGPAAPERGAPAAPQPQPAVENVARRAPEGQPVRTASSQVGAAMVTDPSDLPVANIADTAIAAAYSVVLGGYGSEQAAQQHFRDRPLFAAAVTIVPARGADGTPRYVVVSGAAPRRAVAEGIRADYRARGAIRDTSGGVIRLPFAVQVESGVPIARGLDSLVSVLNRFRGRGFPAYALEQPTGRANVYVGAFAQPEDARNMIVRLQAAGLPAALVVRKGRAL